MLKKSQINEYSDYIELALEYSYPLTQSWDFSSGFWSYCFALVILHIRVSLGLNGSFLRELVVLHTIVSMFGNFLGACFGVSVCGAKMRFAPKEAI